MTQANPPLSADQVKAIVMCMLSTAKVDGIRPEESQLIQKFYAGFVSDGMPAFDQISTSEMDIAALLQRIPSDAEFSEQLILMCLMAGYADGKLSSAEISQINGFAAKLKVSAAQVDALTTYVKDTLIGALAHLPDSESVAALRKTM